MLQDGRFFLVRCRLNAVFSKYCDLFDLLFAYGIQNSWIDVALGDLAKIDNNLLWNFCTVTTFNM